MKLIKVRERRMWAEGRSVETLRAIGISTDNECPPEGLKLLRTFCETGVRNTGRNGDGVLLAKEFLYYRVLDMFAQVHFTREAPVEIAKSKFPLTTLLVSNLKIFLFVQSTHSLNSFRVIPAL